MNPYFVIAARYIASFLLKIMGIKVTGDLPHGLKKFVLIGAPHTANRDFIVALGWLKIEGIVPMFVGKESLFYWPYGWFFRWLGGIPDNRYRKAKGEKTDSIVETVIDAFNEHENMAFGIAPEGTRKLVKQWKFGFYHIAIGAKVPIVIACFDYGKKEARIAGVFHPTGDIAVDMPVIMSYYKDVKGYRPELFSLDERYADV